MFTSVKEILLYNPWYPTYRINRGSVLEIRSRDLNLHTCYQLTRSLLWTRSSTQESPPPQDRIPGESNREDHNLGESWVPFSPFMRSFESYDVGFISEVRSSLSTHTFPLGVNWTVNRSDCPSLSVLLFTIIELEGPSFRRSTLDLVSVLGHNDRDRQVSP